MRASDAPQCPQKADVIRELTGTEAHLRANRGFARLWGRSTLCQPVAALKRWHVGRLDRVDHLFGAVLQVH